MRDAGRFATLDGVLVGAARLPDCPAPYEERRELERAAARQLLRRLLAETASARVARLPIAARDRGQPYLPDRPEIGVSLSHSGPWVAAAVRPAGLVGVDVQVPGPVDDRMVRRCCTPSARTLLGGLDDEAASTELAWIWTVQEACVKATGDGIAGAPWRVPVEAGRAAGRWRRVRWRMARGRWPVPVSVAAVTGGRDLG